MAEIEERQAAQNNNVRVLLDLIQRGEISSIGDDHWIVYDDKRPEGYKVTDQVERLIARKLAKPKGYYDLLITEAGETLLAELNARNEVRP